MSRLVGCCHWLAPSGEPPSLTSASMIDCFFLGVSCDKKERPRPYVIARIRSATHSIHLEFVCPYHIAHAVFL